MALIICLEKFRKMMVTKIRKEEGDVHLIPDYRAKSYIKVIY